MNRFRCRYRRKKIIPAVYIFLHPTDAMNHKQGSRWFDLITIFLLCVFAQPLLLADNVNTINTTDSDAHAAFNRIYQAATHVRCRNCHAPAGIPRQGEDSKPHTMNITAQLQRNETSKLKCESCHGMQNGVVDGLPPGAGQLKDENHKEVKWHMPLPETGISITTSTTKSELCQTWVNWANREAQKNRKHKDCKYSGCDKGLVLLDHLKSDPLIRWAWYAGKGRSSISDTHNGYSFENFIDDAKKWVDAGMSCQTKNQYQEDGNNDKKAH